MFAAFSVAENIKHTFNVQHLFFIFASRAFYERMCGGKKVTTRQTTDDNIIRHVHFACRVTKYSIQTHTYNL